MTKIRDNQYNAEPASAPSPEGPPHCGRYEVERVLGRGTAGTVYLARDPLIERAVAIKSFRRSADVETDPESRARFEREVRIAGAFAHPGIVTVFDVGLDADDSFIAMEYLDGGSLEALMARQGVFPVDRILELVSPLAEALDYAHEQGVIHRDVKPGNILLTSSGAPKLTDFGVARLAGSRLTRHGMTYGSPAYMSPEQAAAQELTQASDQFSLAVIVYEMLTGELPFSGESLNAILFHIIKDDPAPPQLLNPLVSEEVGAVMMRALSKQPAERYTSCADFCRALQGAAATVPRLAPSASPTPAEALHGEQPTTEAGSPMRLAAPVSGWAAGALRSALDSRHALTFLAVAAVVLLVAGYALFGGRSADPSESPGAPSGAQGAASTSANEGDTTTTPTQDAPAGDELVTGADGSLASSGALPAKLAERAGNAAEVLTEIMNTPESGIPRSLLQASHCVAVIPGVKKVGFGFGGRYGRGLVSCRTRQGWSRPSFVAIGGGSFGLQIGGQSSDLVLVFVDQKAAEELSGGSFLVGGDASVSAGPVGRTGEAGTDVELTSEIYSYSRSRGLFAGLSLEGSTLTTDTDANAEAYGRSTTASDLLLGRGRGIPPELLTFVRRLEQYGS